MAAQCSPDVISFFSTELRPRNFARGIVTRRAETEFCHWQDQLTRWVERIEPSPRGAPDKSRLLLIETRECDRIFEALSTGLCAHRSRSFAVLHLNYHHDRSRLGGLIAVGT